MNETRSVGTAGRSRGRRFATALATAALAVTVATACSDAAHEEDRRAPADQAEAAAIEWGPCPAAAEGAPRDPGLTCATVEVPLNYDEPDGASIEVAVSRLAAADPAERHGVLLLNPGGPALSGLDMPGTMAPTLPQSVLDGYDLIGFDPRGVEHSTPQSCGLEVASVPGHFPYPAADGSIDANVELARTEAQKCAATENLRYFTTANTARDLDRVREALGEQKISYWGQSYGTYLGAVYSSLYPERTDRMILEGNIDPTQVWSGVLEGWGESMAERFPDAAAVAAAQNDTLGLGGTVDEVTRTYLALADRLDREPAPVPGTEQSMDGATLRIATYALLLDNENLPILAQVWKAAANLADGRLTAADGEVLAQVFAEAPPTPGVPTDNQATMFLALTCGDAEWSHDVADYAGRSAAHREAWPLTAGMPANIWPCAFWPAPIEKPVTVTDEGPGDILILQNRRDHATSWASGQGLRQVLGDRAAFVGVENGGHYVYDAGSACADRATVDFLSTGHLPEEDVFCTDVERN
ncbi:TAP domain protein [Xylanimonas cellulosilytica DSM 15894]|uniref:TAP domain protein n=1 Tax=Xylanimonas cellulosilytica (strain DSM 15894 / JCM 12276 / CECT 5975 / KCTC 9989 / LMG 20990 / NBRC 107835 / XIL07) TaxID=446471 RepID=D1C0F8_XYLCX|nr:alpha/beta hydrolase [Xylanimonas cellulosilytica]ACZ32161.1 TAP domain protein [Xylanimonas cellulosilytica DSM 15894]